MKQRHLVALLVVLVPFVAWRWSDLMSRDGSGVVAPAVVRTSTPPDARVADRTGRDKSDADRRSDLGPLQGVRDLDTSDVRNAFAVRLVPVAAVAPAPPVVVAAPSKPSAAAAAEVTAAIPPPPPAPPPLQVIGSWRDDKGASLFFAGPRGVLQGRVGDVLLSEFRIIQITPQQVLLRQLNPVRDIPLAIPSVAAPSLASSK